VSTDSLGLELELAREAPEVLDHHHGVDDSAPPAATAKHGFAWVNVIGPFAVFVVMIGLWYLMHYWALEHVFNKGAFLIPPPHRVVDKSLFNPFFRGELLDGLLWTAIVAAVGLVIAIVVGVLLAVLMAQASWLEVSLWPYLIALQAIPILAIVPIIALVLDYGFTARVFVCVIISLFPIVSNTLFGLLSADRAQHDLFTLGGASRWTRLRKLQLPAALPAMFTGFRIASGLSVIGAVVGELFFRKGGKGIGLVMDVFRQRNQNPPMFGALILSALLGILFFTFFGWLGKAVVGRWHETTRKTG
jgi:NitT/TauT family transport system permease protein